MQVKETIGKTQIACWGQSNKNLLAQVSGFFFFFLVSHIHHRHILYQLNHRETHFYVWMLNIQERRFYS